MKELEPKNWKVIRLIQFTLLCTNINIFVVVVFKYINEVKCVFLIIKMIAILVENRVKCQKPRNSRFANFFFQLFYHALNSLYNSFPFKIPSNVSTIAKSVSPIHNPSKISNSYILFHIKSETANSLKYIGFTSSITNTHILNTNFV